MVIQKPISYDVGGSLKIKPRHQQHLDTNSLKRRNQSLKPVNVSYPSGRRYGQDMVHELKESDRYKTHNIVRPRCMVRDIDI